ncbi:hypothetical protein FCULG_00001323 [Fusarium culmorum]|uniref:Uncharacterized protein n=1 Tax=Fusarium culmorum TaxID=5516 RepID=A0A2T4GK05_FUSCU|nr:hypothetical protein FCULG_00001323 [Fusarium culmorum]
MPIIPFQDFCDTPSISTVLWAASTQAFMVCHKLLCRDLEYSRPVLATAVTASVTLLCRRKARNDAQSYHAFYRVIEAGHLMFCRLPMRCYYICQQEVAQREACCIGSHQPASCGIEAHIYNEHRVYEIASIQGLGDQLFA